MCFVCGYKNKRTVIFAEYKHENGKVYLRSNKYPEFTRVELKNGIKKGHSYIKVIPVKAQQLLWP